MYKNTEELRKAYFESVKNISRNIERSDTPFIRREDNSLQRATGVRYRSLPANNDLIIGASIIGSSVVGP